MSSLPPGSQPPTPGESTPGESTPSESTPGESTPGESTPGSGILHGLLGVTVILPALCFAFGTEDGEVTFVLYREPKLVALAISGWLLLATFFWLRRKAFSITDLTELLERPAVALLAVFLAYLAASRLWVRVIENHSYELYQYLLLFLLLIVLVLWARHDARVVKIVRYGLIASLAVATLVGMLQALVPIAVLRPIDPEMGVSNPSLWGYKNPMALALLGQIFLLARLATRGGAAAKWRLGFAALLVLELFYLASLQSRTSYAALGVASLYLAALGLCRRPRRRRILRFLGVAVPLSVLFVTVVLGQPAARQKIRSIASYVTHPRTYLDSDRGIYLRNTLNMVRHHPFGVGLGDWQTHYPVYRLHRRAVALPETVELRRAHSDHVQFLGEAGWPGLVLWVAFLLALIGGAARRYLRSGEVTSLFVSAQVVALAAAMGTDYCLEMPYHKFQFFLIAFLALARPAPSPPPAPRSEPLRRPLPVALALLISGAAVVNLFYYGSLGRKIYLSAAMTSAYSRAIGEPGPDGRRRTSRPLLLRIARHGLAFDALAGHTKTQHRDYLLLTHALYLLGDRDAALGCAEKSLELHPYHPNSFKLMAELVDDPRLSERWLAAYDHLMHHATGGFEHPYPPTRGR